MAIGIVGRKCGMTRLFAEDGSSVAVTVIEATPNRVVQRRLKDKDGYAAVQVTTGTRRPSRVTKPQAGHVAKAGVEMGRGLWELRLAEGAEADLQGGSEVRVDQFVVGQRVDITGRTKGKGFAGTVKRHHFRTQDATHGNSLSHRAPGSIGQNQDPGRVFKGKAMAGHLGAARRTVQNLVVVRVDIERNLLLIKGAVPGSQGGDVVIRPAIKTRSAKEVT
ncbi:MAG: 50S ribosomal protein L3 [Nitrococcus sp.]|nr:50S ribosomal protein L3 [Nitrococcus sp.]